MLLKRPPRKLEGLFFSKFCDFRQFSKKTFCDFRQNITLLHDDVLVNEDVNDKFTIFAEKFNE